MSDELPKDWPIDLGDGYRAEWHGTTLWIRCRKLAEAQPDDVCPGAVRIPTQPEGKFSGWECVTRDPITIRPSISVSGRGGIEIEHGFITAGKWVPV